MRVAFSTLINELRDTYKDWEGVEQFSGTVDRLIRMYEETCWSPERIEDELSKHLKVFDCDYDQMLVEKDIDVWSLCPHHLVPCNFKVAIGYIPKGKVLGLSKFARIAEVMARRPILQEAYSVEIAKYIMDKLDPKGVAVYIRGKHGCMLTRGIKQDAWVITSNLQGCFLKEVATREEFYAIVRNGG